jgi:hypothetical protein
MENYIDDYEAYLRLKDMCSCYHTKHCGNSCTEEDCDCTECRCSSCVQEEKIEIGKL